MKLCWLTRFVEKTFGLVSVILYKGDFIMESLINCDFLDEARILGFIHKHSRGLMVVFSLLILPNIYSTTTFIFFVHFSHLSLLISYMYIIHVKNELTKT
jgi:hypothetical protein